MGSTHLIIGAGKMGGSLLSAWISSGLIKAQDLTILDPATFIGMLPGLGPMSIIAIMIPVAISLGDPSAALILLALVRPHRA